MIRMRALAVLVSAVLGSAVLGSAVPAQAEDSAEQRLERCLLVGASAAPQTNLVTAITAARSFCGAQLRRVRSERVAEAQRGLSGGAADAAERRAIRQLNNEVAATIARITGLNR